MDQQGLNFEDYPPPPDRCPPDTAYLVADSELQLYRELFAFAPDAYVLTDSGGIILQVNYATSALLEFRLEFLVGKPLAMFVDVPSRAQFYARLARLRMSPGPEQRWEASFMRRYSPPVQVSVALAVVMNRAGQPQKLRWHLWDVSSYRNAVRSLAAEKDFADSLADTAPALILVLSASGHILRLNRHVLEVTGYREADLVGKQIANLIPRGEHPILERLRRESLEFQVSRRETGSLLNRTGRQRFIAWSMRSLATLHLGRQCLLLVGQDITELHEAQQQALEQERLAGIGQVMASLAHESRNGLQRILSCLERLRWRLEGQPEALELVARALDANADLTRLFEEVRTYARPLNLEWSYCDLASIWREAWQHVCPLHSHRRATMTEDFSESEPRVNGDSFRLGQVFRNIFENAFDACPAEVRMVVTVRETTDELNVGVRDNGPGVGDDQRQRIFEPFYTTRSAGTGLGMAIARQIMEAHDGRISVHNHPGGGAEFVLTFKRSES